MYIWRRVFMLGERTLAQMVGGAAPDRACMGNPGHRRDLLGRGERPFYS